MVIGINQMDVEKAACLIRCSTFSTHFIYLGVKVGDDMSKSKSWDEVTFKLSSRLSKWNLNTLSIGGCLTLLESGLTSIPLYHESVFKVPIGVLNKMESISINFFNGVDGTEQKWLGLVGIRFWLRSIMGVSSYSAFNRALLFKWDWRFYSQGHSLWARWVMEKTPNEVALKVQFPRVCALESQKDISVVDKKKDITLALSFCRSPSERAEEVTISAPSFTCSRYSSSSDLRSLGVVLGFFRFGDSFSFISVMNVSVESTSHLFFSYYLARQLWNKVFRWWDIDASNFLSYDEWLTWLKNIRMPKGLKDFFEGVCYVMWRVLWRFRNQTMFGNAPPRRDTLFDDIVRLSHM
nr:RNA-directed DNA polymerase, eukaryota [Tanacetum cinerariifolium]